MSEFWITNAKLVLKNKVLSDHYIQISNGIIEQISSDENFCGEKIIDAKGAYLCPGFLDLHIHGMQNYLLDNGPDDLISICSLLVKYGVTGFLPTLCPMPKGQDSNFLKTLSQTKTNGAEILGFHLEGPFLTITGALPPEALGKADPQRVNDLIDSAKPFKAIFSISPDFENITELLPIMSQNNTPVFITHTKADVDQTDQAIKAGASHATHFYDVFYPPQESDKGVRPCGAVEAVLANEKVTVDFILDGIHVHPAAVKMALKCKGGDKVCLITDANIGAGNEPGRYMMGKEEIEFQYPGSPARGTENSNNPAALYGSGLTMNISVKNAVKMLGIDITQAVKMASTNPAAVLNLSDLGTIEVGKRANLTLMDQDYKILATWIDGKNVYTQI